MKSIWMLEKKKNIGPNFAEVLMGEFPVRMIASASSLEYLLKLDYKHLPNFFIIDPNSCEMPLGEIAGIFEEAKIPSARVVYIDRNLDPFLFASYIKKLLNDQDQSGMTFKYKDIELDWNNFVLKTPLSTESEESLTPKEARILQLLMQKSGQFVSREDIKKNVWQGTQISSRTIDSHISRLRKRLAYTEARIDSSYGGGYVLR
jgi:DNA-binding CsgD family transcriptional regulator